MSSDLLPLWSDFSYKEHQVAGVKWMIEREDMVPSGGLLCDEMGLGKTIEVLGLLVNNKKPNTLLLCPKAVISQWLSAAKRSRINCCEVNDGFWSKPSPFFAGRPFLFITNYEKVPLKPTLFAEHAWDRVVLDEAHKAKNRTGNLWKKIHALPKKSMWCVTATPIVNDLKDLRNLFGLVGYDVHQLTNYSTLLQVVSQALLHRSMEEMRPVLAELPDAPNIVKKELDFIHEEEAEFYRGVQGILMRRWKALPRDSFTAKFALLMRLRQLSVHPQVYINARRKGIVPYEREDFEMPSTKFTTLRNILREDTEHKKWIVFCQFHDEMDLLEAFLSKNSNVGRIQMYHGGMKDSEKEEAIQKTHETVEGGHDILLVQLQSGGVGLNLQHFSRVIFMSPWWTAALMDQAIGRAVRIGQREEVEVTLLLLKEESSLNIDDAMIQKAEAKRDLLTNIFRHANKGVVPEEDVEDEEVEVEEVEDSLADEEDPEEATV
jgi:SNF2 family DNA or RNA helicase